jgi:ATP-binding cassette subfamily F protein uup
VYLKLENLYFWQKGRELLKNVSLSLATGDRLGLVGSNGSGKSTLLKLIAGELVPESGSIIRTPGLRMVHLEQSSRFTEGTVWQVASQALAEEQGIEQQLREEEQRMN